MQLLKSRGLIINDEQRAEAYIQNIGYYRLSAYMHISLLSEIRFRVMKALPSIAFNEFKGSAGDVTARVSKGRQVLSARSMHSPSKTQILFWKQ